MSSGRGTFVSGTAQTVLGDLWINRATLRSTSPGQTIDAGIGSVDSDRNVNWTFPARGTVVIIR